MENLAIEIKFAQNLAGNETKTRLKALKKLKKYLRAKSASKKDGFSTEDLLKLWKGLHYCMWMQDKPLLQEELSTTLTQLVHDLSTVEAQMLFIKVFFITEAREWNSIDIWRLDKFMMMVRNMLCESFMVLKKLKWENRLLDQLMEIFSETVMNPDSDGIPDGLKIHFSDIYLEEVEKVGEGHLTGAQLLKLLVPFVKYMQKAKNMTLLKRVKAHVFEPVITRLADEVKLKKAESSTGDESKEQDVPFRSLKFDGKLISDHLFQVGQEDCVLSRNRPVMYELVKKIKDIQEGVLPEKREIVVSEGVTHKDVQKAVNDLIKLDGNKNRKKLKKKKKNKQAKQNGVNENADPNNNRSTDQDPETSQGPSIPQIGEKRKHSFLEDDTDVSMTKIKKKKHETENTGTEKKTLKKLMNKFSKLDVKKGKKDKKSEIIQNEKAASPQSKKKLKSSDRDQSVTHDEGKMEVNVEEVTSKLDTEKAQVFTVSAEVPTSQKSNEGKTADIFKTKGKRTYSQTQSGERSPSPVATPSVSGLGEKRVPDIVVQSPSPVVTPVSNTSDLQDGEIEIWIPNKKYKGNKTTTPQSNFAVFEHSKPPAAFVKRSLSKSLKKTPSALKTPGSGRTPGSNKRVSFDMKKNKAQAFKESLSSPLTPFNPSKKPESGILKSPAPESMLATSSQGQGSAVATKSTGHITISQQTPVTRQSVKQIAGKKVSHVVTPVVSLGFEKKKATPAKRHRAADFFL